MAKPSDSDFDDWEARKDRIIGLGERSLHKNYYPQLRQNIQRLERFRILLDQTSDYVILVSRDEGLVVDANEALARLLGVSVESLIGRPFSALGLGDDLAMFSAACGMSGNHASCASAPTQVVEVAFHSGESLRWLELAYSCALVNEHCYGVIVGRDISERKRNHEMMASLLAEKDALLENAMVGIAMLRQRQIMSCNRRFEEMFAYPAGSLLGESIRILYPSTQAFTLYGEECYSSLGHGHNFSGTIEFVRADGHTLWCEATGHALNQSKPQDGSIWIFTDITERKEAEERAKFLAYHDDLTGLPNLQLVRDRMQQAVNFTDHDKTKMALMVLDVDHFKTINDSQGYSFGNKLLVEVAQRLKLSLKDTDTLCRKGGDEFLILLPHLNDAEECVAFLAQLMLKLSIPFYLEGIELALTVSTGIAMYPDDGSDLDSLLQKAEMAMYQAKEVGRNTYRFFDEEMNQEAVDQLALFFGLRRALEHSEFELYYQPQIDIGSDELIGAEALIRWNHPEFGLISPARFIPVAEESGLIVPIGEWVLCEACREAAKWQSMGKTDLVVAVNLSALQFKRGDIEQSVIRALAESGLNPSQLELELTESILVSDTEKVLATVIRLKHLGIKLSIDDFGTGYSSLSYLKRFKVDKLKIDQSFIRDLAADADDAAIVRAVIQMARSLGMQTIAEGVEDQRALDLLRLYRCDEAQGYFYSRPMPAQAFFDYQVSR